MATTYYAWTDIKAGTLEKPVAFARGAKVTRDGLGVSVEEWQGLLDSGAIRDEAFPAPKGYEGSAIDWYRDKLSNEGLSTVEEASAFAEIQEMEK